MGGLIKVVWRRGTNKNGMPKFIFSPSPSPHFFFGSVAAAPLHKNTARATRDHEVREHITHTWASSDDNLFQSNFRAWSSCKAILGKAPNWPI